MSALVRQRVVRIRTQSINEIHRVLEDLPRDHIRFEAAELDGHGLVRVGDAGARIEPGADVDVGIEVGGDDGLDENVRRVNLVGEDESLAILDLQSGEVREIAVDEPTTGPSHLVLRRQHAHQAGVRIDLQVEVVAHIHQPVGDEPVPVIDPGIGKEIGSASERACRQESRSREN